MPKISIIIPVYNAEEYIDICLKSIVNQSFTDFEVIIVNDGSSDNSQSICENWAGIDPRIQIHNQNNQGVSCARNNGVIISKAPYITFIDADDTITPEYLDLLYKNIIEYKADMSVGMFNYAYKENHKESDNIELLTGTQALSHFAHVDDDRFRACMAKLVSRHILVNNPFPTDRTYSEDFAVIYKWYYDAKTVVSIERWIYNYNINETSISNQSYGLHRLGDLKTWNELISFLENNNFWDLYEEKLPRYANAIYTQYNALCSIGQNELAKLLRIELKRIVRRSKKIKITTEPHIYSCIFPFRSNLYWNTKSIVGKLLCLK